MDRHIEVIWTGSRLVWNKNKQVLFYIRCKGDNNRAWNEGKHPWLTPRINASSVTLYYLPDKYKNNIIYDNNHALVYMCQYMEIKAQACNNLSYNG